jgi:broad specificity phosphatase PhoE
MCAIDRRRALVALAAPAWAGTASAAPGGAELFWSLLKKEASVVLMRHAITDPGVGDPPGFRLDDCRTQRNLSEQGREQARRVGQLFASQGVVAGEVRSSAWCRCTETARLAFGEHTVWPALNSFFQSSDGPRQTRQVLEELTALRRPGVLVLVTHQVNITALTGEVLAMGELFLTRRPAPGDQRLTVRARLSP